MRAGAARVASTVLATALVRHSTVVDARAAPTTTYTPTGVLQIAGVAGGV